MTAERQGPVSGEQYAGSVDVIMSQEVCQHSWVALVLTPIHSCLVTIGSLLSHVRSHSVHDLLLVQTWLWKCAMTTVRKIHDPMYPLDVGEIVYRKVSSTVGNRYKLHSWYYGWDSELKITSNKSPIFIHTKG